ncbi:hypothetical protein Tco_0026867 [Tanacetum coccineum]
MMKQALKIKVKVKIATASIKYQGGSLQDYELKKSTLNATNQFCKSKVTSLRGRLPTKKKPEKPIQRPHMAGPLKNKIHEDDIEKIDLKVAIGTTVYESKEELRKAGLGIGLAQEGCECGKKQLLGMEAIDGSWVLIRATWQMRKSLPTWLLWLSQIQRKGVGYNAVPPLPTALFSPPTIDLSNSDL